VTTGTIDAASTPFLSPDTTLSTSHEIHQSIPPMSTFPGPMSLPQRHSYSYSQAPTPPIPGMMQRRQSGSMMHSNRASPSPSTYSGYSQSAHASPSLNPQSAAPTPPGSLSLAPSPIVGPLKVMGPGMVDSDFPHGISMPAGSQSTYELMTISTSKGLVPVPVEVHVASRQADEKRKRNAGASARFRQRRKEKEREANTTIDRLRHDLQCMTEDCEYYKSERNRLLDILKESPGWERHLARSPSPSHRRREMSLPATSSGGLDSGAVSPRSPTPASSKPGPPAIPESERNIRRKLDVEQSSVLPKPEPFPQPEFRSPFPPFSRSSLPSPEHAYFPTMSTSLPGQHSQQLSRTEAKPPVPVYGHNWSATPPNGHS
jgi:hypothetical protein